MLRQTDITHISFRREILHISLGLGLSELHPSNVMFSDNRRRAHSLFLLSAFPMWYQAHIYISNREKNRIHYYNLVSLCLCSQLREDHVTEKKALTQRGILVSEHVTFL